MVAFLYVLLFQIVDRVEDVHTQRSVQAEHLQILV